MQFTLPDVLPVVQASLNAMLDHSGRMNKALRSGGLLLLLLPLLPLLVQATAAPGLAKS